jgi:gamma-glutamyl hydrolase
MIFEMVEVNYYFLIRGMQSLQSSTQSLRYNKKHKKCIGVLSMTTIDTSYINWFQDKVDIIHIPYDTTDHKKYFNMVHGIFIPGNEYGVNIKNKKYIKTVTAFFILSLNNYFPIWGTCFGCQLLIMLMGDLHKLKKHAMKGKYPIKTYTSRLFGSFSKKYIHFLEHSNSTVHDHLYGISVKDFVNNDHLRRFYTISATVGDDVAAIEATYYPIYGTIFHPERHSSKVDPFVTFFISELKH